MHVLENGAHWNKHQGKNAWSLAGDGWKQACTDNLKEVLAKTTVSLNTPRTAQVDDLFEKVIGLKTLSSSWRWKARSLAQSKAALDDLVTLRGSIAHRVATSKRVGKQDVLDARELLARLAVKSHNAVNHHIEKLLGARPWEDYWFGETK